MQPETRIVIKCLTRDLPPVYERTRIETAENVNEALQKVLSTKDVLGFQLAEQLCTPTKDGGRMYGEIEYGAMSYFGEVFTFDELKESGEHGEVIADMQERGSLFVVKLRQNWWVALGNGSLVYDPDDCRVVFSLSAKGKPTRVAASTLDS